MPAKGNKHALDSNKPIVFVLSTISPPHVKRLFIETIFAPLRWQLCSGSWCCRHWAKWRVCRCAIQTETSLWRESCFVTPGRGLFQKKMKEKRCLKINCARHWACFFVADWRFAGYLFPALLFKGLRSLPCTASLTSNRIGVCNVFCWCWNQILVGGWTTLWKQ